MYVFLIHSAVEERVQSRFSSAEVLCTKARASSGVAFGAGLFWARAGNAAARAMEAKAANRADVCMAAQGIGTSRRSIEKRWGCSGGRTPPYAAAPARAARPAPR